MGLPGDQRGEPLPAALAGSPDVWAVGASAAAARTIRRNDPTLSWRSPSPQRRERRTRSTADIWRVPQWLLVTIEVVRRGRQ